MPRWVQYAVLAIGFTLGVSLMGVQMATSRILTPYFGSDINVWACLISTVMLSLMVGYYIGGMIADRFPRTDVLGGAVLIAGAYLFAVPMFAEPMLDAVLDNMGDGVEVVLLSASLVMFVPLTLLSFFSPYAVRLLLSDAEHGGRVAGSVYSITTIGNIVGTLGAALYLMTFMGSREIMTAFSIVVMICGGLLILLRSKANVDAAQ